MNKKIRAAARLSALAFSVHFSSSVIGAPVIIFAPPETAAPTSVTTNANALAIAGSTGSTGTYTVSGSGTVLNLTTDPGVQIASVRVAGNPNGPNATGTLNVLSGGKILIDGTPDLTATGVSPEFIMARNPTSTATALVDGAGSSITFKGNTGILLVAASSSSDNGTAQLSVTNGAVIQGGGGANDFNFLGVGGGSATAGNGTVLISGTGSRISLGSVEGVGSTTPGAGGGATIGRGKGTGTMTVSSGGALVIDTTGLNATASPFLNVGRDGTSTGTLNISGVGSKVTITSDTVSPFMAVGRGGIGSLSITGGGLLQMNGNGTSTVANSNQNQLNIGGSSNVVGGTGTAVVSGAGSRIEMTGTADGLIRIGRGAGSNGSLSVQSGGDVSALTILVGTEGGTGNLIVNGGTLNLSGTQQGGGGAGRGGGISIGSSAGSVGTATLTGGAIVNIINNGGGIGGGISIGGNSVTPGGVGSLNVAGGSILNMGGTNAGGGLGVGRNAGVGTMTVSGAGTIVDASGYADGGRVILAANAAATGTLTVANNALVNSGALLGVGHDGTSSTGGTGTLILNSGGKAQATSIFVGAGGVIAGSGGILSGTVVSNGGFISPGLSPGQLTIEGGYSTLGSGKFLLEIQSDGSGGFLTDSILFKGITAGDLSFAATEFDFAFLGDTNPLAFFNSAFDTLDSFFLFDNGSGTQGISHLASLSSLFNGVTFAVRSDSYLINSFTFTADGGFTSLDVSRIPEPATWTLLLSALAAGSVMKRRRRAA